MKKMKVLLRPVLLCLTLLTMIGTSVSIKEYAYAGVNLCLRVVIPSLFPFFVICIYLNSAISRINARWLRPLGRICRVPYGAESIILIGLLGGYPVGAQCVAESYNTGAITKADAERMLGFCNNAGPAFIFGMLSLHYPTKGILFLLWLVQIISSILTAFLIPGESHSVVNITTDAGIITIKETIDRSIKAIITVCAWVVIFKIIVSTILHFPKDAPGWLSILLSGIIELVNGCNELSAVDSVGLRFILGSAILSFGGICVHMQTVSVTENLNKHYYLVGKILQTILSGIISFTLQLFIFQEELRYIPKGILPYCVGTLAIAVTIIFFRKRCRFSAPSVIQ